MLERLSRSHIFSPEDGDMWIFAYGSLMWDPGFIVAARKKGRLFGWHRRFCVHSVIYRGTLENPGLSLGLDLGGSCVGFALKILEKDREQVLAYLSAREMPEEIYSCRSVIIFTADGPITAVTLTVNRDHRLYCPPLTMDDTARRISRGRGDRGKNRDYLEKTVALLAKEGIRDSSLIALLDRVRQLG